MNTQHRGKVWWTVGAQKGVGQPPYLVRDRGRWWRTLPLHNPGGESMSPNTRMKLEGFPVLQFGQRRGLDYLNRTGRHFRDLPLWE